MSETQVGAPRLDGQKVGLAPVTFQSVTTVAPAAGVATALPLAASYAGGAPFPLAVLLAAVAWTPGAIAISELARHLPSAGGLATYVSHGLGPIPGSTRRVGPDVRLLLHSDLFGGLSGLSQSQSSRRRFRGRST